MCSFSVGGPALLVVPLFVVSLVNLLIAGPPLKTIVLESSGAAYGASLPFMQLHVGGDVAKFTLMPNEEMTHFFVVIGVSAINALSNDNASILELIIANGSIIFILLILEYTISRRSTE